MSELVKPMPCRGCAGKGYTVIEGNLAYHSHCGGTGLVEGDPATLKAAKATIIARAALIEALQNLAEKVNQASLSAPAIDGLNILRINEPERYANAIISIRRGHSRVVAALAEYYEKNRPDKPEPGQQELDI